MVCPTGALREQDHLNKVISALADPKLTVVAQHAPAVSVTVGEAFGLKDGADCAGQLNAALRQIGFKKVFDTSFSADLTIMEEGSELVERIKGRGVLPMLTSCSPGWIKFVEQFYPEFIPNLSTCKSPQQMLGAVIKSHFADIVKTDPAKIYSVSIMPCTAKKFEAARPGMGRDGCEDIDAVLTTRELAELIKLFGVNLADVEPEPADTPFGTRSSAGKLFGATGGVMEAAVRSAHYLITGKNMTDPVVAAVRELDGIKEAKVVIGDLTVGVAVVSGLLNARRLLDQIKAGRDDLHFIEVMTCPGGCIAGGGQPYGTDITKVKARMKALYGIDKKESLRFSHENDAVAKLYADFLGKPLSHKSHELLHTHYVKREPIM
jgi:iron-only hydrogenase group A